MPRKPKTQIAQVIEILKVADLRLRVEIPLPRDARIEAFAELVTARDKLQEAMDRISTGGTAGEALGSSPL